MEAKQAIRKQLQIKRDEIPADIRRKLSEQIQERVLSLEEYKSADIIFNYCAVRSETDTGNIAMHTLKQGKTLCYPRIETGADGRKYMEFYRVDAPEDLSTGYYGIPEPLTDPVNKIRPEEWSAKNCFMVVPGCGFDRFCRRMGYGGGFYDRYLALYPDINTTGICFEAQITDCLLYEAHDVRMQRIVTEAGVYRRNEE